MRSSGKANGGKHAGEPIEDDPFVTFNKGTVNIARCERAVMPRFDSVSWGSQGAKRKGSGGGSVGNGAGALPMILPQGRFCFLGTAALWK
ncbi:MAG: hypothetical protein R3D26_07615 [Cyanobacteriota/Melainabacteria group bacterium]